MAEPPQPFTPPDADLQDFDFMPLRVARLRDSDFAAEESPEACWYAVLLWASAWHQLPAGSLPDNDAVLMKLVGLGRDQRTWRKFRAGALRNFQKCSDGRLYHRVVAEQVIEAWRGKLLRRWRTECARIRKNNQRNKVDDPLPEFEAFVAATSPTSVPFMSRETCSTVPLDTIPMSHGTEADVPCDLTRARDKGQGQGQGQGDSNSDTDVSDAEPPTPARVDPVKVMFDAGIALLADAGITTAKARPILGKWRQAHGTEAVITALSRAQRHGAIDPISFIEGCFRNGRPHRPQRPPSNGIGRTEAAAQDLIAELERGASQTDRDSHPDPSPRLTHRHEPG